MIPDEGFLSFLLQPFSDNEISVVGGVPYISPISIWDKTLTLFWIFSPENDKDNKTGHYAPYMTSSFAIRSKVFISNQFPKSRSFRGQITDHNNIIQSKGYKIFRQTKARVLHPSINGLRHAITKSLAEGHDFFLAWRGSHDKYLKNSSKQKHSITKFIREKISLYNKRRKYITLSTKEKIGVFCCASFYSGFLTIGFFLTLINPRLIEGTLKI